MILPGTSTHLNTALITSMERVVELFPWTVNRTDPMTEKNQNIATIVSVSLSEAFQRGCIIAAL